MYIEYNILMYTVLYCTTLYCIVLYWPRRDCQDSSASCRGH